VQNAKNIFARRSVLWRVSGALVLGVLLARWSWILFAPHSVAVPVASPQEPAMETGQLFGATEAQAATHDGWVNATLVGVFAPSSNTPGFAVLMLDGKDQLGLALGESTPSGAKLVEIHPDHVVLERAGARQRVALAGAVPTQQ
jgi:hypothetical protein